MTPDGIDAANWDRVHELAVDIANCSIAEDGAWETGALIPLIGLLDELDDKYGPKPSLLATRADYVQLPEDRARLLLAAYSEAERITDATNRQLTDRHVGSLSRPIELRGVQVSRQGTTNAATCTGFG